MNKTKKVTKFLFSGLTFGLGIFSVSGAFAESSPIYYDTFYRDYYKAYPDAKPVKKTTAPLPATQNVQNPKYYNGVDPYMQYQTNAVYNQSYSPYNSYYQKVNHDPSKWEFEIKYKKGEGQFMFENDVHSILNWDEVQTNETIFSISRDFMLKNRQYVFNFTYGSGSSTTDRTSDDDIFNELHLISLGKGKANLKDMSLSVGMRNVYNIAGFDVTPVIGYKKKEQNFEMSDHSVPAPFFLEYFCEGIDNYGVCTSGIDLGSHGLTVNDLYYTDAYGERDYTTTVDAADLIIPGSYDGYDNLYYGMQIAEEDFCYVSATGRDVCLEAGEAGSNLLDAFGGVSSLETVEGVTHMYYVTWKGPFIGVNLEKMIGNREIVHIYGELFKPSYEVWGNWPNRVDWQHDPSFVDEGGSAWGFSFDATYKYLIKNSIALTLGVNYEYIKEKNADTKLYTNPDYDPDGPGPYFLPNAILLARWKHYGVAIGLTFKL